jgi:hypothetical protein
VCVRQADFTAAISGPRPRAPLAHGRPDEPHADAEHDHRRQSLEPGVDALGCEGCTCGVGDDAEDQHAECVRQSDGDGEHQRLDLGALGAHEIRADHGLAVAGSERMQCAEECGEAERDHHGADSAVGAGDQVRERITPLVVAVVVTGFGGRQGRRIDVGGRHEVERHRPCIGVLRWVRVIGEPRRERLVG